MVLVNVKFIKRDIKLCYFSLKKSNNENYKVLENALEQIEKEGKLCNLRYDQKSNDFMFMSIMDNYENLIYLEKGKFYEVDFRCNEGKLNADKDKTYVNVRNNGKFVEIDQPPQLPYTDTYFK